MERPFFLNPADPKNFETQDLSDEGQNPGPDGSYSPRDTSQNLQHPTFNINISPDTDIYGRLETVVNRISTNLQSTSRRIRNCKPNDRPNIAKTINNTGRLGNPSNSFYTAIISNLDSSKQPPKHFNASNNLSHNSISRWQFPSEAATLTSDLYRHSPLTTNNLSSHFEKFVSKFQTSFFTDLEKKKSTHPTIHHPISKDISFENISDINKYLESTKKTGGNGQKMSFKKNKKIVDSIIIDRHNKVNILKDTMMGDYIQSNYKLWHYNDIGVNLIGVQELIVNIKRFNGE
jgi:hypothetical protein